MSREWKYGDVVRRQVLKNPPFYTRVMYIGQAVRLPSGRVDLARFAGVQLTEPPPPPAGYGSWYSAPPAGSFRPQLERRLFEKDPDAD